MEVLPCVATQQACSPRDKQGLEFRYIQLLGNDDTGNDQTTLHGFFHG